MVMMKMVRLLALMFGFLVCAVHASKKSKMTQAGKEESFGRPLHLVDRFQRSIPVLKKLKI